MAVGRNRGEQGPKNIDGDDVGFTETRLVKPKPDCSSQDKGSQRDPHIFPGKLFMGQPDFPHRPLVDRLPVRDDVNIQVGLVDQPVS